MRILMLFLVGAMVFSCSPKKDTRTSADLPFIGQHDVVYEETEGYNIGDTMFHVIPEWKYLNQDSVFVSSSDFQGKIKIANFFFSYCPTICRPMNIEMNNVNLELSEFSDDIQFLSFSIDERRDSPSRLKFYIESLGITATNWDFLTGDQVEIEDLAIYGFQILAQEDDAAPGGFIHSSSLVLVDQNNHIRGMYDTQVKSEHQRLISDVKVLLGKN